MSFTTDFIKEMKSSGGKSTSTRRKKDVDALRDSDRFSREFLSNIDDDAIYSAKEVWESEDIAPLVSDIAPVKESKLDFFQKGAFSDGYDFGDITKAILGTAGDAGLSLVKGVGSLGEGITDALNYGAAKIGEALGDDDYAERARARAQKNSVEDWAKEKEDYLNQYSVLGRTSDAILQGIGQVGGIMATGGLGAAAGLGAGAVTALTTGTMFASGVGSGMSEAYEGGATDEEAERYGLISGAADAVTELLFGGLGKAVGAVGLSHGLSSADDMLAKVVSSKINNQIAKNFAEYGIKASAEGLEEVIAGIAQAGGKKLTYMSEKDMRELLEDENLLEQFVTGAVTSGMIQSGIIPGTKSGSLKEANESGRDFITGLNQNEQTVIDLEVQKRIAEKEQDGKKLTTKEKNAIEEQVVKDMDKGYISIDTIEEALGGDSYKAYKETVDSEDALKKELDDLRQMEKGKMNDIQVDRLNELKGLNLSDTTKRDGLKSQLSESVFSLAKDSRLVESYNEKSRRGQTFEADLSKYDTKQQAVIQKAIDSGILNNTNRTHEFVDLIAKISADKGVPFDFINNAKLKESGFAVDGKQVNGFVTKDGISLNIDSAKALNTTVGHEITHVLEGTELYTELQTVLFEYSKNKGDFSNRRSNLEELYKGIEDADIDAELTADLVGDYLFTDTDFINRLSTEHRNVFQKIYDEVKYLCKVVTAGSKEARQLEQVKRAFEEAYRAQKSTAESSGTKYSLNQFEDGRRFVDVGLDQAQFDGLSIQEMNNRARQIIKSKYGGKVVGIDNKLFVNGNSAEKYVYYARGTDESIIEAKARASTELDNLIDAGTNFRTADDGADGHNHPEVVDGFSYFDTVFKVGDQYYSGTINIKNIGKGKLFWGITKVENITQDIYASYGNPPTSMFLRDVSMENVPQKEKSVKHYSLSDADGRELSPAVQKRFGNSKVVDENGKLKTVYHGTYAGEFSIFDKSKGSVEGDFGSGFYFTDNEADVSEHYEGGGPDYENKVSRRAEQIADEEDIDYDEAEQRAREELYKGSHKFEVYLNIENPAIVGETMLFVGENIREQFDEDDYDDYDEYLEELDQAFADEIDNILWEVERNVDVTDIDAISGVLYEAYGEGGIGIEELKAKLNELYLEDSEGNFVANEVARQIIESLGYDGIVDPTVSGKWNMDIEDGTTHYIVFKPNQIKAVTNQNPTDNPDIHRSLSKLGETPTTKGIYGKDIALEAPVQEVTPVKTEVTTDAPVKEDYVPEYDEYSAPYVPEIDTLHQRRAELETKLTDVSYKDEWDALNAEWMETNERISQIEAEENERFASLDEADIPPEIEAPYSESEPVTVDDPFENRNYQDVGNRKVKAYMYENPEVKPFFQLEAEVMLGELQRGEKGQRFYADVDYSNGSGYTSHGVWTGQKRTASDDIAYLLDNGKGNGTGYTYAEIEAGLKAIIEDNGKENNACSKRIEFILHDRLKDGYHAYFDNTDIPPNQDYINLLNEKQINEYSKEAFDAFMANADAYAPPVEDVAPVKTMPETVKQTAPIYDAPVKEGALKGQQTMFEPPAPRMGNVASVLTKEPKPVRQKRNIGLKAVSAFVDKGMVFENLSHETGNMELQSKWDYALPSKAEARAQYFMKNGDTGVKSLDDIRKEVGAEKEQQFAEYLYHVHNIDRMTLDVRFGIENKAVFGDTVTAAESTARAKQYEAANPEFKKWAQDVYTYNKHLRKQLVDKGVISQETADLWEKMYPHYVPVRRVDQTGLNINVPLDTNKTGVNAPVKRATGGNSDILPLFDTMAQRTIQTYKAIARNDFGIELKNTLNSAIESEAAANGAAESIFPEGTIVRAHDRENFGRIKSYNEATGKYSVEFKSKSGHFATVQLDAKILSPVKPIKAETPTNVDEAIDNIDFQEELLKAGAKGMNPTFTVFENGERVEFAITEDMYDALKPANGLLGHTFKGLNAVSNARRNLITSWNPVFALYRNPVKDIQDVLINSQHPARTYANIPRAIFELATKGEMATEYHKNGGEQNTYFESDTNTFKAEDNLFKKAIGMPIRALENAGNFIEQIPRLAEYIASRNDGRSVERSMLDAARVTTNFAAGGDVTKFANRHGFTFLNASVQGASQHVRNIREAKMNGLKGWAKLAAKVAVAGLPHFILNGLMWEDDEEYEELSDYVKDNYYVIAKTEDGKFIRIPKGRVSAVIQDGFEQISNAITGDDEVDLENFLQLVVSNLAPNNPLENNILAPIGQALSNTTWYGDDLVPSRLQDVPAAEQYDESTDSISRWLGEKTGISPYKINYLLDQYSGGVGDVFLPMLTPEAESGNDTFAGNMIAPWKKELVTDSVLNNQNVTDFYDLRDELEVNANSMYATQNDEMKNLYMDAVGWDMSDLYKKKREIQNSDMSDSEKYEQTRELQRQIDELAKEGLNGYDNVSVAGSYAEIGNRRFNYDSEKDTWYEIQAKNADGSDNYWYQREQEVTKALGISYGEYWNHRDEYNFAYDKPGQYGIAKAVGGYDAYMEHYDYLENWKSENYIGADKDENGKSINGTRKPKVIDYINELDADYGEKIILFKSQYPSDDSYNYDIVEYLNNRDDISYKEMEAILVELGFNVDADGRISWD